MPDCLHTATFFPEEGVEKYVAEAVEAGARVFKSHIQVGAYDPNDPLLEPVWGLLAEAACPGGHPLRLRARARQVHGAGTHRPAARHPRLRLIVAHMGMPEYTEFLALAETYREVRLDTTMTFTDFTEDFIPFPVAERGRLAALGDRILLGTDFPNIPYPYAHQLHALERLGLGDDWLRAVCHDNADALFA